MNAKFLRLVLNVEAVIYLLLHNLHYYTFKSRIYILLYYLLLTTIIQNLNLDSVKRPWRNVSKFLMSTLTSLTPLKKCGKLKS